MVKEKKWIPNKMHIWNFLMQNQLLVIKQEEMVQMLNRAALVISVCL